MNNKKRAPLPGRASHIENSMNSIKITKSPKGEQIKTARWAADAVFDRRRDCAVGNDTK
jgi:hypothetical protein